MELRNRPSTLHGRPYVRKLERFRDALFISFALVSTAHGRSLRQTGGLTLGWKLASRGEGEINMVKERNLSVVPKTKGSKSTAGKNANRTADDAAKKAQKTEQKYEEKRGIFTK